MQNNYGQYGQFQIGNQYPAYNNQQGYQYIPNNMQNNYYQYPAYYQDIKTNQINNIKDDSSSRDQYYNDHVACIVVGNNEFYKKRLQIAKRLNKDVDQLVGTDFSFGKYLNFETNEEEWLAQLEDLKRKLSIKNPKFANLKGIKFVLDEHGGEGNNRFLAANSQYYKSKRFQQVAQIINENFLNKNKNNKLYFTNLACYGTYNFNECNKKNDSDTHDNNGFWSNNIYEILSNEFGSNRNKVYCSQLIPQSGINTASTMNLNNNPYRNGISFSSQIGHLVREDEKYEYNSGPHDFRKKYFFEYNKLSTKDLIPSPECKIYFPLNEFRNVVPNYHTKPITKKDNQQYVKQEKYYKVDGNMLKNYTGKTAKDRKNDFLKWGDKPKYVHFDENQPFTDPYGYRYDNLHQCVYKWRSAYVEVKKEEAKKKLQKDMEEAKKFNQQKKLQKDNYERNKVDANYNNQLLSLYNDKVNDINGCVFC